MRAWGQLCGLTVPSRGFLRPRCRLPEIPGGMGAGFWEPHLRPPCGSRGSRGRVWAAPHETRPSFHPGQTPEEQGELLSEGVLGKSRKFCRWSRCLCDLGRPCLQWGPDRERPLCCVGPALLRRTRGSRCLRALLDTLLSSQETGCCCSAPQGSPSLGGSCPGWEWAHCRLL